MGSKLPTPNSELRTIFSRERSLEEILSPFTSNDPPAPHGKMLFVGEGAGGIASYVAGWMAGKEMDVIVLDGANRFDPYMVSAFARKALIPPERLLRRIQIARAFTCYQMATLMGEKLISVVGAIHESPLRRPWVILLGPITTFLDEDVPEREVRPLFERSLKRVEEMAREGVPFMLFQPPVASRSNRGSLMKRLSHFSDLVWRVDWDDQGTRLVLEKGVETIAMPRRKDPIRSTHAQRLTNIR